MSGDGGAGPPSSLGEDQKGGQGKLGLEVKELGSEREGKACGVGGEGVTGSEISAASGAQVGWA